MIDESIQDDQFYRNKTSYKLILIVGLVFFFLLFRLYYLQVIQYEYHFSLSEENRIRPRTLRAVRGLVYDRNGKILARNRPSYQICILRDNLKEPEKVFNNLMKIKDSTGERIFDSLHVKTMMQRGIWRKFEPLPILEDASMEIVSIVEEHQLDLKGVVSVVGSRREYPYETAAAHVLGYTIPISTLKPEERESYKDAGYDLVDRIGRKGLERYYENQLKGEPGKIYIEVNAFGKQMGKLQEMANISMKPGHNLYTTIDIDIQVAAEKAFPDTLRGALVAIDPRNGEILAMLSRPNFNGNMFSLVGKRRQKASRNVNEYHRAVQGGYPPGSVFKAIVSLAGFNENLVDPEYKGFKGCTGGFKFGNFFKKCWHKFGHGKVDFYGAFKQSCDVYYYQLGLHIGMDPINHMAGNFGLGKATGIDLDGESPGLLMDSSRYNRRFKKQGWKWTRGQVLNLSIGQGQLVTPIQLANMVGGLGNGQKLYRPHLMKQIKSRGGKIIGTYQPFVLNNFGISKEEHGYILEAMRLVVEGEMGTGHRAKVKGIIVGGKTGSAENPHGKKTHALFMAVAPLYSPEIAIAVIMENAGHGGSVAAPVVGKVLNYYFKRDLSGT